MAGPVEVAVVSGDVVAGEDVAVLVGELVGELVLLVVHGARPAKAAMPLLIAAMMGADSSGATEARSGGVMAVKPFARSVAVDSCSLRSLRVCAPAHAAASSAFLEIRSAMAWLMVVLRARMAGRITSTSESSSTGDPLTAVIARLVSLTIASESVWIVVVAPPVYASTSVSN